jgi:hypothetical protein
LLNLSYSSWPCYKTLNIFSFEYFWSIPSYGFFF